MLIFLSQKALKLTSWTSCKFMQIKVKLLRIWLEGFILRSWPDVACDFQVCTGLGRVLRLCRRIFRGEVTLREIAIDDSLKSTVKCFESLNRFLLLNYRKLYSQEEHNLQPCLLPWCYWFWVFLTFFSSSCHPQLIRSLTGNLLIWSVIDLIAIELNGTWVL